jgi:hypothetical protein
MIQEKDVLHETHYGLNIYAHILREYYPDEVVIKLSGKECAPARNPFNGNKITLHIFYRDGMFCFFDDDLSDFKGDPFDFAEKHYHLTGDALVQKINEDMHLRIGENWNFYRRTEKKSLPEQAPVTLPVFSFFRRPVTNTKPDREMNLVEAYIAVKAMAYKQRTIELRSIHDREQARRFKAANFDYVTFSGTFSNRNDRCLIRHSGLLAIDFDQVHDLEKLRNILLHDPYFDTELMFVSPSGKGLKWVIPIDLKECSHQEWFLAVAAYLRATYTLEVDKSGKDISRACFLPFDPQVYINPLYLNQNNLSSKEIKK